MAGRYNAAFAFLLLGCGGAEDTSCGAAACDAMGGADVPSLRREPVSGAVCGVGQVGTTEGSYAADFAVFDQGGQTVLLSDFCGQVVALGMGAMWCPTCQNEAKKLSQTQEKYGARGLLLVTLLSENAAFEPITQADLGAWAEYFALSTPVLADRDWNIWDRYFEVHATPRSILLDPEGKIIKLGYVFSDEDYEAALSASGF